MATLLDIGVSAVINILSAFAFLLAFALLRIQPINDRVYFTKWYVAGLRDSHRKAGSLVGKFVNLNWKTYLTFLNWMPQALKMSEDDIIRHAGLDSAVFLRMHILGLKIFAPIAIVALLVLVPVNVSSGTLFFLSKDLVTSEIDNISISNVPPNSSKFFVHIALQYLFTIWICVVLYKEYEYVSRLRFTFLASEPLHAKQFTVVVRNIPHVGKSVSDRVERFFRTNHPTTYLCQKVIYNANKYTKLVKERESLQNWLDFYLLKYERQPGKKPTRKKGFLGLWGEQVDSIEYYKERIREVEKKVASKKEKVLKKPKSILPVSFVSFNSRWGAAVCAQTEQSKNPTHWLTDWAPEPRDIYWKNLAIPFVSLSIRRLIISFTVFLLVFFYMIPIAFVQSLANLEGLERVAPFLMPVIELDIIKSFIQGFLPGLVLKIFLLILSKILMVLSEFEGYISHSALERRTSAKYYYFMLVNVFLGSIVTGTAFQQLHYFLHQSPTEFPRTIGVSIPMKATFFITYIMVDGWAGIAAEILQVSSFILFHVKNMFLVKTVRDREKAMDIRGVDIPVTFPRLQLYFLLGIVYAIVTPILLPFILVFFAFAYFVFRHQVINVYHQKYESAGAFWPHFHSRIIASLVISQLLLMGLLSTKKAANSTPLLVVLPILTFYFHKYCKKRFEPAFTRYPIEEAMAKDISDQNLVSEVNQKKLFADAYKHPIFWSLEEEEEEEEEESIIATNTAYPEHYACHSSPSHDDDYIRS